MTVKDKEFLNLFWTLSAKDIKKRENAIKDLIQYFSQPSLESNSPDIRIYTLERLVKGLKSIRNLARVGYGTAFCAILEKFGGEIDRCHVMKIVKQHLYDAATETKAEGTGQKIGQLFAISSLARAGLMKKCSLEEATWLLESVIPLLQQQDYHAISAYAISTIISQLKSKVFAPLFPSLESALSVGWEAADPESLLLLLSASTAHPSVLDRAFLKVHWDSKKLLVKEKHQTAALALLERSFEGREGALAAPHPLGAALARALAADPASLAPLWRTALQHSSEDRPSKASNVRAKAAALHLFCELVLASADDPQPLLALAEHGTPVALLRKQLARPTLALHALAAHFAKVKFPAWCERAAPESRAAVLRLLTNTAVDFDRELPPDLRLVLPLLTRSDQEALADFGRALREAFAAPQPHTAFLANQMRLLIVTGEALNDADIQELLLFLAEPLLGSKAPPSADPRVAAFFKSLEWLSGAKRFRCVGRLLRRLLRPLLKAATAAAEARASEIVATALQRALELVPKKGEEAEEEGEGAVQRLFALLFAYLGLHALADARGMDALLQDVQNCFEKAIGEDARKKKKKRKSKGEEEEEEPHWTEVMTDCLLSLLSQGSRLLRSVVRLAFGRMLRHLTPTCATLLADVLLARVEQRKKEEEEEDLLDFQNEEEEEEEDDEEEETEENAMEVDEEDEDSSEEEEEEEEEDQAALQRVRENVRSALGEAAVDEDEAPGSDMDDAAMFRLDSALVAAFKAANKGGHTKKAVIEKKRQLLQLKSRCLDLVEMVLSQSIDPAVVEPCLRACVELLRRPDEAELKVSEALAALKKRQLPMATAGAEQLLKDGVRALCRLSHKAPPIPALSSGLASATLFLFKALGPEDQAGLVREEVTCLLDERAAAAKGLLTSLIERHPPLGWCVRNDLVQAIRRTDLRPFQRTQALTLLSTVLKFNSKAEDAPTFLAHCAALAAELLEAASTWEHPALARRSAELGVASGRSPDVEGSVRERLQAAARGRINSKVDAELRSALRRLSACPTPPVKGGEGGETKKEKLKKKQELRKQRREEKKRRREEKEKRRQEKKRSHSEMNGDGEPLEEAAAAAAGEGPTDAEPPAKRKKRKSKINEKKEEEEEEKCIVR